MYDELKKDTVLWNLFTSKEEYKPKKLDKYGRFLSKYSRYEDLRYPQVSEFLIENNLLSFNYPENKKFAVVLTHDIDDLFISNQHVLRSFIPYPINRDFLGFKSIILERLKDNKSSYNNFKQILLLEKKYNAKSSFYFLAKDKDIFGVKYKIDDIQDHIHFIIDNECEIGLHTSYYAFDKLNEIISEKERLEKITGKKVKGVRNHFLRFNIPNTWEVLSKAGLIYDTTLGYHDEIGFRNGMCHPYQPFNLDTNSPIDITEIPLCISDVALFSYLNKSTLESWQLIKNLIDTVEKLNGVLTILWHNWTFSYPVTYAGLFGKEWTKLYEKILQYCYEKNAWLTSCSDISDFYLKNLK